jgi:hypothetical protein
MLTTLAMSLEEWKCCLSASLQYRRGQRLINRYFLPVEFLIGGFVYGNGVVMRSVGKEAISANWVACIGCGGNTAFGQLMARSQQAHMSITRSLVHLAEAMHAAHSAYPGTVGHPSDYIVLTQKQIRRMPSKDESLRELVLKYAGRDTEELDSDEIAFNAIQAALYSPGITKEDYAQGIRAPGNMPAGVVKSDK